MEDIKQREQCFAYIRESGRCKALSEMVCKKKEGCPFFKTRQQYKDDLKKYGNVGGVQVNGLKHPEYSKRT